MEQNQNPKQTPIQQTPLRPAPGIPPEKNAGQTAVQSNSSAQKIITQTPAPGVPRLILEEPEPGFFAGFFSGRMNRQNFIVGSTFFGLLPLISVCVILFNSFFTSLSQTSNLTTLPSLSDNESQLLNMTNPTQLSLSSFTSTPFDKEWITIGIVLFIISAPYLISMQIKRLHDLNLNGWLWIINIIPFFQNPFTLDITSTFGMIMIFLVLISTLFSIYMTIWPGTNGSNKYGAPPPAKSRFLRDVIGIG